jgi:uncharacterized heparinase superfamily protein
LPLWGPSTMSQLPSMVGSLVTLPVMTQSQQSFTCSCAAATVIKQPVQRRRNTAPAHAPMKIRQPTASFTVTVDTTSSSRMVASVALSTRNGCPASEPGMRVMRALATAVAL